MNLLFRRRQTVGVLVEPVYPNVNRRARQEEPGRKLEVSRGRNGDRLGVRASVERVMCVDTDPRPRNCGGVTLIERDVDRGRGARVGLVRNLGVKEEPGRVRLQATGLVRDGHRALACFGGDAEAWVEHGRVPERRQRGRLLPLDRPGSPEVDVGLEHVVRGEPPARDGLRVQRLGDVIIPLVPGGASRSSAAWPAG